MAKSMVRTEPSIPVSRELTTGEFAVILSWYGAHCDAADAAKFFSAHLKDQQIEYTDASVQSFVTYAPTVGFLCRIVQRGGKIPASSSRWLDSKLSEFRTFQAPKKITENDRPKAQTPAKQTMTIQDRMKQQVSKCIGDLEGHIDTLILSEFKTTVSPLTTMRTHEIKGPQATQIINWFKRWRDEYRLAASSSDADFREAYSNFTKPQLNKLAAYCDQIMTDGLVLVKESMASRSPRQRKKRLPEQIVKSVQYQQSDEELKLTSVEPTQMVGAMAAWTYHCPTRTLTLHVADDASGLTFKGTTVMNASATQSVSKKLRKPADTLKEVLSGSKTIIKKLMGELTTKPTAYKNRMNKDTIIVRVHK